jgi:hypothetical protein
MSGFTTAKAIRWFVYVELIGLGLVGLGALQGMNTCLVSLGLMVMFSGSMFLSMAATIKIQERAEETARQQAPTDGEASSDEEGR